MLWEFTCPHIIGEAKTKKILHYAVFRDLFDAVPVSLRVAAAYEKLSTGKPEAERQAGEGVVDMPNSFKRDFYYNQPI